MNVKRIKLRNDAEGISRRRFFNSAYTAGVGVVAAYAVPNAAYAGEKDKDDENKGHKNKGHKNKKDKEDHKEKEGIGPSSLCELPNSIPHVFTNPFGSFHFFFPGPVEGTATSIDPTGAHANGRDPSVIYNFNGFIGQADLSLTGTGTNLLNGASAPYSFNADMRFMKGSFVGTDGKTRRGAFAFI